MNRIEGPDVKLSFRLPVALWIIPGLLLLAACESDENHPIVREAKAECEASGLDPKDAAFAACVKRRSDEKFKYWLRVMKSNDG